MLNNQTEIDLLQAIIQKMTFSYCIPLPILYDWSYAIKENIPYYDYHYPKKVYKESQDLSSIKVHEDYIKISRRYSRIFERFTDKSYAGTYSLTFVDSPKIYDGLLFDKQITIYNNFAKRIGFNEIDTDRILPDSLIKDAATLDGAEPDYKLITKYYPYYRDDRNGVTFFEFVLYINMFLSSHYRSIYMIDKQATSAMDELRAKEMVDRLIMNMTKEEMFKTYIDIFLDVYDQLLADIHLEKLDPYVRELWLPE